MEDIKIMLKFKAWDKVKKQMFRPLAITFDTQSSALFAVSVPGRSWEPIHKYEILQYTGLTDKNGAEVFQGDLFEIESSLYRVIWAEETAGFKLQNVENFLTREIIEVSGKELRGNVYQNSELLP